MKLVHHIVKELPKTSDPAVIFNYDTVEEIAAQTEPLGIDGIYEDVWENREVLQGKDFYLFVVGDTIGGDNSFDTGQPLSKFCTNEQILDLVDLGGKLAWHTWSHRDLTKLTEEEIKKELESPLDFRKYLAYPYGKYDDRVIRIAKEMGYLDAWSVTQGTGEPYKQKRSYI
jgi:peptidoglycan/xylan/chitin deacetylase (PgdA/CDA1 family)